MNYEFPVYLTDFFLKVEAATNVAISCTNSTESLDRLFSELREVKENIKKIKLEMASLNDYN